MESGSRKARALWRGLALAFAISVVALRLGIAGCSPAFFGPTKAGGGFNGAQPLPPTTATANGSAAAGKSAPSGAAGSKAPPPAALNDPSFFPPTKAAGGFYPPPPPTQAQPQAPNPER